MTIAVVGSLLCVAAIVLFIMLIGSIRFQEFIDRWFGYKGKDIAKPIKKK